MTMSGSPKKQYHTPDPVFSGESGYGTGPSTLDREERRRMRAQTPGTHGQSIHQYPDGRSGSPHSSYQATLAHPSVSRETERRRRTFTPGELLTPREDWATESGQSLDEDYQTKKWGGNIEAQIELNISAEALSKLKSGTSVELEGPIDLDLVIDYPAEQQSLNDAFIETPRKPGRSRMPIYESEGPSVRSASRRRQTLPQARLRKPTASMHAFNQEYYH